MQILHHCYTTFHPNCWVINLCDFMNIYKVTMATVIHNIMDIHKVTHDYCWNLADLQILRKFHFNSSRIREDSENPQTMMENRLLHSSFSPPLVSLVSNKNTLVFVLFISCESAGKLFSDQFSYSPRFINWPSELRLFPLLLVDESRLWSLSNLQRKCTSLYAAVSFKRLTSQGEPAFKV